MKEREGGIAYVNGIAVRARILSMIMPRCQITRVCFQNYDKAKVPIQMRISWFKFQIELLGICYM